jgi:Arc/MetJ family transcription regulator
MRTNIDLDDVLINKAKTISGLSTKKEIVHVALEEFVKSQTKKKILLYKGKKIWDADLNEMRKNK